MENRISGRRAAVVASMFVFSPSGMPNTAAPAIIDASAPSVHLVFILPLIVSAMRATIPTFPRSRRRPGRTRAARRPQRTITIVPGFRPRMRCPSLAKSAILASAALLNLGQPVTLVASR